MSLEKKCKKNQNLHLNDKKTKITKSCIFTVIDMRVIENFPVAIMKILWKKTKLAEISAHFRKTQARITFYAQRWGGNFWQNIICLAE